MLREYDLVQKEGLFWLCPVLGRAANSVGVSPSRLVCGRLVFYNRTRNAHGTEFREVLYRWHPWFGLRVAVHETVSRLDGIVFRCTLTGGGGRQLELPAWMFDRAACRDCFPLATSPLVSTMGLRALSDLLQDVLRRGATASTASPCGASCASRNEDVGEARARQHDERRTKALSDRRSEPRQFDLFGGNRPRSAGDTPTWSTLPAEARSELIGLMETTDPGARGSRAAESGRGGQP